MGGFTGFNFQYMLEVGMLGEGPSPQTTHIFHIIEVSGRSSSIKRVELFVMSILEITMLNLKVTT